MSAIASAATAAVLAIGVAVALDAQPGRDHKVVQVRPQDPPGPAQVELSEHQKAPTVNRTPVRVVDPCPTARGEPDLARISAATRALSAWPEMSYVLRPATRPDPVAPPGSDLLDISVGSTTRCPR